MFHLKEFYFKDVDGACHLEYEDMTPMGNLDTLQLPFMYKLEYLKPYLNLAVNLRFLFLGGLSEEILDFCKHMKYLKKIYYHYSRVSLEVLEKFEEQYGIEIRKAEMLNESENRRMEWMEKRKQ